MRVLCVFGTRPEAIKMAPVIRELRKHSGSIETRVCVTGQHREMLDQVLGLFSIIPDYDLDLMHENQSLSSITASVLIGLDPIIQAERPDWILVQGDTTTAMAATVAAFYRRVRAGHVEAGLRSWNMTQPFPEEANRRIADALSDLHFAPTEWARQNLLREGVPEETVYVTGNTVIDALHWAVARPRMPEVSALLSRLGAQSRHHEMPRIILVTAHRRENFGEPFRNICAALRQVAARYPEVQLVYPVHLNPNIKAIAHELLADVRNISLLAPLDYLPLVQLLGEAYLVLTDSGGLQEEAPGLGKPVLVLRDVTERPEGVDAGVVRLVGTDTNRIVEEMSTLLDDKSAYASMAQAVSPYGDGRAAERTVAALLASS